MITKITNYVPRKGFDTGTDTKVETDGYIPLEKMIDLQRVAGRRLKEMHRQVAAGSLDKEIEKGLKALEDDDVNIYTDNADDSLDHAHLANIAGTEINAYNDEVQRIRESGGNPFQQEQSQKQGPQP